MYYNIICIIKHVIIITISVGCNKYKELKEMFFNGSREICS